MIVYTVQKGDSLYSIAQRYGVLPESIQDDNFLTDPSQLVVGQTLVVVKPQISYVAESGENAQTIAEKFGISLQQLWRNNPVLGGQLEVEPGQFLKIKIPAPYRGKMRVNAYAYPFVDRAVLRRTLPYLTYLTIFTYGIRPDGTLIPIEDEELIGLAREYGVAPVMHLSSLTEEGTFSNQLSRQILNDAVLRQRVIAQVEEVLAQKQYVGVDVDFEYVGAENAKAYATFLQELKDSIGPKGYEVWVALAPKVRADQEGVLYEGHDYAALGNIADRSLLMTYEWGYTYGPPMAVAPLDQVRRVVDFAIGEIPSTRLFLGVPNYGYDWALPYVPGESRAQSLGNVEAVDRAWNVGAEIQYDETAQAPYYRYYSRKNGVAQQHEVWFEDGRSVEQRLALVPEYNLYGIGIWNIMKYFPQLWLILNGMYELDRVLP